MMHKATNMRDLIVETARTAADVRLCEHGVSFAPGEPCGDGTRSAWCGECFEQCECGQLFYIDRDSATLPFPVRGTSGELHTCEVPS